MKQKLTTTDAVFIGLASMLGAGVFVVFAPAANYAGPLLPLAVIMAATVAYLNATSIAQLAKVVTRSGGAYAYARHYLNPTTGYLAGMAFLLGKLGSVAAIALTFATYLTPGSEVLVASMAIVGMTSINIWGINRTAFGAKILASVTASFLLIVILAAVFAPEETLKVEPTNGMGVFTAAALLFFAFAGYARIATLGGEVENPAKAIPRAIVIALAIVFAIYLALSFVLPVRLGSELGASLTPIADLVERVVPGVDGSSVAIFASVAALGSLLALIAGMSRTAATMAEDNELPKVLARINSRGTPYVAEWSISGIAILLVATGSFEFVIGLSSFAVLTYYAIANLAAIRQPKSDSSRSKLFSTAGLLLCLALAISVPVSSLALGSTLLFLAVGLRWGLAKLR